MHLSDAARPTVEKSRRDRRSVNKPTISNSLYTLLLTRQIRSSRILRVTLHFLPNTMRYESVVIQDDLLIHPLNDPSD